MTREQTRVKVWRPQGFEGVEVEILENVSSYLDPTTVLGEYHVNVDFRRGVRVGVVTLTVHAPCQGHHEG